jgi:sugar phosphate isomerase/epimerase
LGDDLKVLHVHDNYGGADDRHYYPYRGNVDWEGFYKGLNEIKYQGTLNLETRVAIETPEPMRDVMRKGLYELAKYMASRVG